MCTSVDRARKVVVPSSNVVELKFSAFAVILHMFQFCLEFAEKGKSLRPQLSSVPLY